MSQLEFGSVAWVRLGQAWWPGTIYSLEKCPPEFVKTVRKPPLAVVKFFHENEFQDIHKEEHIYPYSCERKVEFIKRGLYINKNQSHGDVNLLKKFESDVTTAEKLTGGDMNILQTLGEVLDFPSAPDIIQVDLEPDSHNTQIERPRGGLPGMGVIGEPEGPTHTESFKMRSPHSNNTQLVEVDEQDTSDEDEEEEEEEDEEEDDSDCYIEERFGSGSGSMPRESSNLVIPQGDSHMALPRDHVQSNITHLDNRRYTDNTDRYYMQRSGHFSEGLDTSVSQIDTREEERSSPVFAPYQKVTEYKNTSSEVGFEGREYMGKFSGEERSISESRRPPNYSEETAPRSPDVIEIESEPQSPEVEPQSKEVSFQSHEVLTEPQENIEEEPHYSEEVVSDVCNVQEEEKEEVVEEEEEKQELPSQDSDTEERVVQSPMIDEEIVRDDDDDDVHMEREADADYGQTNETKISKFGEKDGIDIRSYAGNESIVEEDKYSVNLEETDRSKIYSNQNHKTNGSYAGTTEKHTTDQEFEVRHPKSFMEVDSHVKENGTSQRSPEPVKSKYTTIVKEPADQSDSEQVVTSSGMGEAPDNQHEDGGCDSSLNESGLEVTLDETLETSTDLSFAKEDVEEADSSLSDVGTGKSKPEVDTSDIVSPRASRQRAGRKSEEASRQSVPKRKREPSQKTNKKLKVNKKEDDADSKVGESDELPDLMVSAKQRRVNVDSKKVKVGDLVWVKYRKDWWPSYVKNVYPRDKKFSIVFIGCDQNSGIRVTARSVKRLFLFDIPSYVNQNQEGFSAALHLCKLFQRIIDGGKEISAHDFFSLSPQAQVALLNQKYTPRSRTSSVQKKSKSPRVYYEPVQVTPKKSIFDDPDLESQMSSREKNKLLSALKARKADNEKLVRFMKSKKCLDYLWKIFKGEIQSERHNKFKDLETRKDLMWSGIGPFQLDTGDEQIMAVINIFKEELLSKEPNLQDAKDYAFKVWIPEAIKEALRVIKKVPESELDEALDKGYRETPVEQKARKLNF